MAVTAATDPVSSSSSDSSSSKTKANGTTYNDDKKKEEEQEEEKEPIEYNPRWRGYLFVALFSLVNFASIANVPKSVRERVWVFSMAFGMVTFCVSTIVLIQDLSQGWKFTPPFFTKHMYTKLKDGYVEGFTLVFFVLLWIVGVAHITRPAGIAYQTSNIYYSSWFSLFSCVYTLNMWSDSRDILSLEEICSVSLTLKFWWIHFIGGLVVFVSSIGLSARLKLVENLVHSNSFAFNETHKRHTLFSIFMGLISIINSSFFILVHYNFITDDIAEEGGWMELFFSLFQSFIWIIAICILTQVDGIAATTHGYDCFPELINMGYENEDHMLEGYIDVINCTTIHNGIETPCSIQKFMPGSNMFFACWTCMLSAVGIALKWKQAKAVAFANAQQERAQQQQTEALEQHQQEQRQKKVLRLRGDGDDDDDDDR